MKLIKITNLDQQRPTIKKMELSDELLEEIGAYLSGRMTAAEKDGFEARMRSDEALRQEVVTQQEIKQGIAFLSEKQRFKSLHADLEKRGLLAQTGAQKPEMGESPENEGRIVELPTEKTGFQRIWSYVAVAASVIILLGTSWTLYQNWADKQQLMAQNEKAFGTFFSPVIKAKPSVLNDPDRLAAPSDSAQNRSDSIRLAESVDMMLHQDIRVAIGQLATQAQGTPGHWSASGRWYLALAYLKANQREESSNVLQQIADQNGHPYQQEARELIEQLRK